jgi:hypothetical protein
MNSALRLLIVFSLTLLASCNKVENITTPPDEVEGYTVITDGNELRDQFNTYKDSLKLVFIVGPT